MQLIAERRNVLPSIKHSFIMSYPRRTFLIICAFLLILDCMMSLKLLDLRVPAYVLLGSQPVLTCQWELGPNDMLYSIKWYKDGKEFFRHVPRDLEPHRKFPLPGVEVEKSDALGSNISLSAATLETGGRYRCEISGERPLFPTVSDHADMIIVEYGPVISGFRPHYQIGDRVRVNCTSGRSRPAMRLAWYLNGEPAPFSATMTPVVFKDHDGFETTNVGLDFRVTEQHFRNGAFKVKCLATLASIYWRSNEESARKSNTRIIYDALEVMPYNTTDSDVAKLLPGNFAQKSFNFSDILTVLSVQFVIYIYLI